MIYLGPKDQRLFDASFSLAFGRLKASSGYVTKGCILSRIFHNLVEGELKNHLLHAFDRKILKGSITAIFESVDASGYQKAVFAYVRRVRVSSGRNDVRLGPDIYEGKNVPTW